MGEMELVRLFLRGWKESEVFILPPSGPGAALAATSPWVSELFESEMVCRDRAGQKGTPNSDNRQTRLDHPLGPSKAT